MNSKNNKTELVNLWRRKFVGRGGRGRMELIHLVLVDHLSLMEFGSSALGDEVKERERKGREGGREGKGKKGKGKKGQGRNGYGYETTPILCETLPPLIRKNMPKVRFTKA